MKRSNCVDSLAWPRAWAEEYVVATRHRTAANARLFWQQQTTVDESASLPKVVMYVCLIHDLTQIKIAEICYDSSEWEVKLWSF